MEADRDLRPKEYPVYRFSGAEFTDTFDMTAVRRGAYLALPARGDDS